MVLIIIPNTTTFKVIPENLPVRIFFINKLFCILTLVKTHFDYI